MKALSLWDVIESDTEPTTLPGYPTSVQIKKREEEIARNPKALSCIHSAVSEEIFTTIMGCESPKETLGKNQRGVRRQPTNQTYANFQPQKGVKNDGDEK